MNFDRPSAMQKSWREHVRLRGSVVSGRSRCVIHHPVGRTARHNKIHIGHWWILPLTGEEHNALHGTPDSHYDIQDLDELKDFWLVNHLDGGWQEVDSMGRHDFEKFLFQEMCGDMTVLPFDDEVSEAIQAWRR